MKVSRKLGIEFYQQPDVVALSRALLGKYLVTAFDGQITAGKIVETEAYRGPDDKACHAHLNRFTKRTRVMFEMGGVAYIYLCYGIHHLFNVVTGSAGQPHAILVRALEPVDNIEIMLERRNKEQITPNLTAGPGILSQAMGIHKKYTGTSLVQKDSLIWIEDRGYEVDDRQILVGPRVGIDYAEECAGWPWRFRLKDSKWTSKTKGSYRV